MSAAKPKVFGLGLSRTGTKSLGQALKMLGYSNHSWDRVLHERWFAGDLAPLFAVTDRVDCVDDWPFLAIHSELMDRYGEGARYVLTVRKDPETWLDSVIAHAKFQAPHAGEYRRMAFGYDDPEEYRAEYLAYYDRHNDGVRAAIAERGLEHRFMEVCWEKGDGWEQLCGLIGRTPPDAPFPHRNHRPTAPRAEDLARWLPGEVRLRAGRLYCHSAAEQRNARTLRRVGGPSWHRVGGKF